MLFVFNGEVVHQQVGALPENMLKQLVDKFLSRGCCARLMVIVSKLIQPY